MLDAYVIDEIKRREGNRDRDDRPSAEIPHPTIPPVAPEKQPDRGEDDRGVVIIDYA